MAMQTLKDFKAGDIIRPSDNVYTVIDHYHCKGELAVLLRDKDNRIRWYEDGCTLFLTVKSRSTIGEWLDKGRAIC